MGDDEEHFVVDGLAAAQLALRMLTLQDVVQLFETVGNLRLELDKLRNLSDARHIEGGNVELTVYGSHNFFQLSNDLLKAMKLKQKLQIGYL